MSSVTKPKSPVDYSEMTDENRSVRTILDRAPGNRWPPHKYTLMHHTAGYECAGSMARYTREVWSVTSLCDGATVGQRFLTEAEARERFNRWTGQAAGPAAREAVTA